MAVTNQNILTPTPRDAVRVALGIDDTDAALAAIQGSAPLTLAASLSDDGFSDTSDEDSSTVSLRSDDLQAGIDAAYAAGKNGLEIDGDGGQLLLISNPCLILPTSQPWSVDTEYRPFTLSCRHPGGVVLRAKNPSFAAGKQKALIKTTGFEELITDHPTYGAVEVGVPRVCIQNLILNGNGTNSNNPADDLAKPYSLAGVASFGILKLLHVTAEFFEGAAVIAYGGQSGRDSNPNRGAEWFAPKYFDVTVLCCFAGLVDATGDGFADAWELGSIRDFGMLFNGAAWSTGMMGIHPYIILTADDSNAIDVGLLTGETFPSYYRGAGVIGGPNGDHSFGRIYGDNCRVGAITRSGNTTIALMQTQMHTSSSNEIGLDCRALTDVAVLKHVGSHGIGMLVRDTAPGCNVTRGLLGMTGSTAIGVKVLADHFSFRGIANGGLTGIEFGDDTHFPNNCTIDVLQSAGLTNAVNVVLAGSDNRVTAYGTINDNGNTLNTFGNSFQSRPGANKKTYAVGTSYSLTATPAALAFGTTSPSVTLAKAGNYVVSGFAVIQYNGATFAASQTVTLKLRRTNNTAADLANGAVTLVTAIVTTITDTLATVTWEAADYMGKSGDVLTIFGSVGVVPSAGSLDVVESYIEARRAA